MKKLSVVIRRDPRGRFHVNVPLDSREKMKKFWEEMTKRLEEIEFPVETSRVKRKGSIFFFEIATDLSKEKIETLANRALEKIKMRKEG